MSILLGSAIALTGGYLMFRDKNSVQISKDKNKLRSQLNLLQEYLGEKHKHEIIKYIPKDYGCDVILSIPASKDLKSFHDILPKLKTLLNADIIAELSTEKTTIYTRIHYKDKDISEIDLVRMTWYDLMFNGKFRNKDYDTFTIKVIKTEQYGYKIILDVPIGLNYNDVLNNLDIIKNAFKCNVWGEYDRYKAEISLTIIKNEIPDNFSYQPYKTSVSQFYIGMTYDYKKIIADLSSYTHVLYSGMTGMGKTMALLMGLTNLIHYHSPKEMELYLCQISGKQDFQLFKNVAHCKYYAKTMDDVEKVLKYLVKEMKRRSGLMFEGKNYYANVSDWNKHNPNNKFSEIFISLEEAAQYQPSARDSKEEKKQKQRCLSMMTQIYQEGRCAGFHILSALQRPSKDSLDAPMKANIGVNIAFKQPNAPSSLVVMGDGSCCELRKREAIVEFDGRYLMKTLYLTPAMIKQYISKWELEKGNYLYLNNNGDIVDDDSTAQKCKTTPPTSADNNLPSITLSRKDKQLLRRKEYLNNR